MRKSIFISIEYWLIGMKRVLFCTEMHLVFHLTKVRKTGLDLGKGLESLQQRPVTLQAHGVFVKIKCQVKLLLIKRKIKDYLI